MTTNRFQTPRNQALLEPKRFIEGICSEAQDHLLEAHPNKEPKEVEHLREVLAPYAYVVAWFELLNSQDPLPWHQAVARRALAREGIEKPKERAVSELSYSLFSHLKRVRNDIGLDAISLSELLDPQEEEGMFCLDARAARFLAELKTDGEGCQEAASYIRENAQTRWRAFQNETNQKETSQALLWLGFYNPDLEKEDLPPLGIAVLLARALWRDKVKEFVLALQKNPPALAYAISHQVDQLCFEPGRRVRKTNEVEHAAELVNEYGEHLAKIPTLPAELDVIHKNIQQLASLTGHRAIRWLVTQGHRQELLGTPKPHIIEVKGGLSGFAEKIGATTKTAQPLVEAVLDAGQCFKYRWEGGIIGGLWGYGLNDRTGPGKPSMLRFELMSVLMPHYAKSHLEKEEQHLVPIVPFPPMVGRFNDHGAQAAFQFKLMSAFVDHRKELLPDGGAMLLEEELLRLAGSAGLPLELLEKVLDRWTQDGQESQEGGERFLDRIGKDRYMLADTAPYHDAREFLLEGSRRAIQARQGARLAISRKVKRLGKPNPKKKL